MLYRTDNRGPEVFTDGLPRAISLVWTFLST